MTTFGSQMNDIRLWTDDVVIKINISNSSELSKGMSSNYFQLMLFDLWYFID